MGEKVNLFTKKGGRGGYPIEWSLRFVYTNVKY